MKKGLSVPCEGRRSPSRIIGEFPFKVWLPVDMRIGQCMRGRCWSQVTNTIAVVSCATTTFTNAVAGHHPSTN